MTPYYERHGITVHHGDCLEVLATVADASVDAVCTDPPYELGFMGRAWDASGIAYNVDLWRECLRVLRPGGHLASFGGTRTYHRMACAIEDAGFEIRDSIHWLYGSGFPKSLDVGKAIDKRGGNAHLADKIGAALRTAREARGWTAGRADAHFCGGSTNWTWYEGRKGVCRPPTPDTFALIVEEWPELASLAATVAEADREVIGQSAHKPGIGNRTAGHYTVGGTFAQHVDITAPATDAAQQWQGFGTALKPAHEPIVLARKPLSGTVAATVLAHGTGALNIDATRVAYQGDAPSQSEWNSKGSGGNGSAHVGQVTQGLRDAYARGEVPAPSGRWPSNVLFSHGGDCDDTACQPGCPVADLDAQSGTLKSWMAKTNYTVPPSNEVYGKYTAQPVGPQNQYGDSGGASRFFPVFRWEAKATTAERPQVGGVSHPTVKPLDLMRWLVRLVTPPGGLVLDPFAGSGTTLHAARAEGFRAIGIERHTPYLPLIKARLDARPRQAGPAAPADDEPMDLLDLLGDAS